MVDLQHQQQRIEEEHSLWNSKRAMICVFLFLTSAAGDSRSWERNESQNSAPSQGDGGGESADGLSSDSAGGGSLLVFFCACLVGSVP